MPRCTKKTAEPPVTRPCAVAAPPGAALARRYDGLDWRHIPVFENVADDQWFDYRWQLQHQFRTAADLQGVLPLTAEQTAGVHAALARFRMAVTPYYASLIDPANPQDPVFLQAVPRGEEAEHRASDLHDPLCEDEDSPAPGLTHRYPDRVLMLITELCAMYCRHCTRRRKVGEHDQQFGDDVVHQQIAYIRSDSRIKDVILSGGDALMLSDERLDWILAQVRAIPHVEIIRIGTRTPVVMPMRITDSLTAVLKKYHPLFINTHFNHPREITPLAAAACAKLADAGLPLGNQTVLLRGVNDCPHVMRDLMRKLLTIRVRPYYIFQCDLSEGIGHFRTPISVGVQIIESLRGHVSGLAVPTFVVDTPHGGGKVPVMPNYLISSGRNEAVLRNFEGVICRYSEEADYRTSCGSHPQCHDPAFAPQEGPARMMVDPEYQSIGPTPQRKSRMHHKP